jgi:acyl-coenzyme A synthetase/AMP-(fatty) acid ligase
MHPVDMIFFYAQSNPEQPALIQSDTVFTYRDLAKAVAAVSERLERSNLDPLEPVAVSIAQPIRKLAVCFALLRRGISAAPVSQGTMPFLRPNGIKNVIYTGDAQMLSGGKNIRFDDSWLRPDKSFSPTWHPARPSPAMNADTVFFTSGTTGMPKKVVLPASAMADRIALRPITGEANCTRVLVVPPVSSQFGFSRTSELIYAGKTACFAADTEATLRMVNLFDIEAIIASPRQILALVEFIEKGGRSQLSSLREVIIGGGFSSPDLIRRVQSRLCRNVICNYGSTEAGLIALANFALIHNVPNAVGFPAPGVVVEIVDENDKPLPAGKEGRVRCRTSQFSRAFIAEHPERASSPDDIWWYPGDIGLLTADGILCIVGRADDVINCGGVKRPGVLLDDAVLNLPGVRDAGVCSVSGPSGVDEIWIGVVSDGRSTPAELKQLLAGQPEFRNSPLEVFTLAQIPRNDLGKLQRFQLKELLIDQKKRLS